MSQITKLWMVLALPLILVGCFLAPGKFTSTLSVNADKSFIFSYKGEVISSDPSKDLPVADYLPTPADCDSEEDKTAKCLKAKATAKAEATAKKDQKAAENETKLKAVAEALTKEAGYRSAVYVGNGKFMIDYAIKGTLDHTFIFPFNSDAQLIIPFVMIEPRQNGTVRVRAPGFAASQASMMPSGMDGMPSGGDDGNKFLDGSFTLDTNAEILNQNNEDGAKQAGGRSTITWRATPLTKDAPSATLRLK